MRRVLPVILIAVSLGLFQSCSNKTTVPSSQTAAGPDLSTPEGVLGALVHAYNDRDPEAYTLLLARDYRFLSRGAGNAPEVMTREQDIQSFTNMCRGTESIALSMTIPPAHQARVGGRETKRIEVGDTHLRVVTPNRTLVMQGHLQLFDFRRGDPAAGEDPERYYLARWEDTGAPR